MPGPRLPSILHSTSLPATFLGRHEELAALDRAASDVDVSVIALVGPGGQGKTAIAQHWLRTATSRLGAFDGVFLWSFYRGRDSDLLLRELFAYAERRGEASDVSASFCVDRVLPILRTERWAIVLDGAEVVQHESGSWAGRFQHPEVARLVEELASAPMPGVLILTSRFPIPSLDHRRYACATSLTTLDLDAAAELLRRHGVKGTDAARCDAARAAGLHAKAVELLGAFLRRFHGGELSGLAALPFVDEQDASDEERSVLRVLGAIRSSLSPELCDIAALATGFRQPPVERVLLGYLASQPVRQLLHEKSGRSYAPFQERPADWLARQLDELVDLRLLERVDLRADGEAVIEAHPLVRAGFETSGRAEGAGARAGFLRRRPDRRPPANLEDAREEVELFHAFVDAHLWNEADGIYLALDNPKRRFLAPAFERDLLLQFFPGGDWRKPPLWLGFGRRRNLAICLEMLGQFEDALDAYPANDAPLRGDALIALGRITPLLTGSSAPAPWDNLWQAYQVHAWALAGRRELTLRLAQLVVPVDIYEWVHVFEGLLRIGRVDLLDLSSLPSRNGDETTWESLSRDRIHADIRRAKGEPGSDLDGAYGRIVSAFDRAGLPFERVLARLSQARHSQSLGRYDQANAILTPALEICRRNHMAILEADVLETIAEITDARERGGTSTQDAASMRAHAKTLRERTGFHGPARP